MLSYKRSTRVAELIQQEICKIVQGLRDPGIGFITITGVKLTDDLQDARIFYSVIGTEQEIKDTGIILENSLPMMRRELAARLNLRRTPVLTLEFDKTPSRANRVFALLEQIKSEEEKKNPK